MRTKAATNTQSVRGREWSDHTVGWVVSYVLEEFEAGSKWPPFVSAHEGLAKIREEYLELEREVFEKKRPEDGLSWEARREEAAHIAAVAIKFLCSFWEAAA